jgi:hypothetical protein
MSAPIKYACGCIVYEKESELEWLVQRGKGPEVPGSFSGGRHFFAVRYFCMTLCTLAGSRRSFDAACARCFRSVHARTCSPVGVMQSCC